jgi:hypothetical protein
MKILILVFLLCAPMVSFADANDDMKIQILNSQIESLTKERDEKYEKLKQCEKTTKGFKIAGITTLVATGFGIYGNVKLAQRLKEGVSNIGGIKTQQDTRSEEKKVNDECAMYCADFPEDAADIGCTC